MGNTTAVPIVAHTHMDQTLVADVLHILKPNAVVHMDMLQFALRMVQHHAVQLIDMLFVVQQDFQHIIIHAVKHILAQAAVLSIIHITAIFAVQHMFIIHTKVELFVVNILLVPKLYVLVMAHAKPAPHMELVQFLHV